ncbi:MAG: response regulator [Candidatus Schekmanbacteria bacterium]|nr:response regulator [Candidatus Schekmanbacteria bacterium]
MATSALILDDDESFQKLLSISMGAHGWVTYGARRISEARRILARHVVDVALIDGLLPDGSGLDFVAELGREPGGPVIVFLSAFSAFHDTATYAWLKENHGIHLIRRKPVVVDELIRQVEEALRVHGGGAAAGVRDRPKTGPTRLGEAVARLRRECLSRSGETAQVLAREITRLRSPRQREAAAKNARFVAHKMKGSAGTFGFADLAQNIEQLEELLGRVADQPAALEPELSVALDSAMEAILRAVTRLLAAEAESEPTPSAAPAVLPPQTLSKPDRPAAKILLVGADPSLAARVTEVARHSFVHTALAASVEEAMDPALHANVDAALIVIDEGTLAAALGLARFLRMLPGRRHLGLAFMLRSATPSLWLAALDGNATLILAEPFAADELGDGVRRLIALPSRPEARLLLVARMEPSGSLRQLLEDEGLRVFACADPADSVAELERVRPDIVLSDLFLPQRAGLDVCRLVRSHPEFRELPVLLLVPRGADEVLGPAFRAGASDYLSMPLVAEEVVARVWLHLERGAMDREANLLDALTGLLTRSAFTRAGRGTLADSRRRGGDCAVAMIEIDGIEGIMLQHGPQVADHILAVAGRLLAMKTRLGDLCCRWGQASFTIAFADASAARATEVLERIRAELEGLVFRGAGGEPVSASFRGVVVVAGADTQTVEELTAVARERLDLAMRSTGAGVTAAR